MSKDKSTGADAPQDAIAEKLLALEAEVERLTAENERLQRALDAAPANTQDNAGSVSFQKTARGAKAPRVDTVIEHGGAFYRVTRPKFVIKGRTMLATDLLTDDGALVDSLMAEYPQLFEQVQNTPPEA